MGECRYSMVGGSKKLSRWTESCRKTMVQSIQYVKIVNLNNGTGAKSPNQP